LKEPKKATQLNEKRIEKLKIPFETGGKKAGKIQSDMTMIA